MRMPPNPSGPRGPRDIQTVQYTGLAAVGAAKAVPLKGMGNKPYIVARLDIGDVIHSQSPNKRMYTASTSKLALAYFIEDQIPDGTTNKDLQRCMSESHAGTCTFLAGQALERMKPGTFTRAELAELESFKHLGSINAQAMRSDEAKEQRTDGVDFKVDKLFAPLVNKVLRDKLGIDTATNPNDLSKTYISNANGGFWRNEQPSRILPDDMQKLMQGLWEKGRGDFLKRHGDPNGGWTHTATNRKYTPTHLDAIAPNKEDQKRIWYMKTGSIEGKTVGTGRTAISQQLIDDGYGKGIFVRAIGFNDKQGNPHMAYVTGTSSEEVNRNARLALKSVWDKEAAPRPDVAPASTAVPAAASPQAPSTARKQLPPVQEEAPVAQQKTMPPAQRAPAVPEQATTEAPKAPATRPRLAPLPAQAKPVDEAKPDPVKAEPIRSEPVQEAPKAATPKVGTTTAPAKKNPGGINNMFIKGR